MSSSGTSQKVGRPQTVSYEDLMKPDEDWRMLADAAERRKIQNRLAQRAYRRNMRDRTKELEKLKKRLEELQGGKSQQDAAVASTPDEQGHATPPAMGGDFDTFRGLTSNLPSPPEWEDHNFTPCWSTIGGPPFPNGGSSGRMAPPFGNHPDFEFRAPSPALSSSRTRSSTPIRKRNGSVPRVSGPTRLTRAQRKTALGSPSNDSAPETPPAWPEQMAAHSPLMGTHPAGGFPHPIPDSSNMGHMESRMAFYSPDATVMGTSPATHELSEQQTEMWAPMVPCNRDMTSQYGPYLDLPFASGAASQSSWPGAVAMVGGGGANQQQQAPVDDRPLLGMCNSPYSPYSSSSQFSSRSRSPSSSRRGSATTSSGSSADSHSSSAAEQSSLLHLAVAGGHANILRLLLQRCDMPIDVRDAAGYTPLQRAVFAGRTELVELLLEYGADGRPAGATPNGPRGMAAAKHAKADPTGAFGGPAPEGEATATTPKGISVQERSETYCLRLAGGTASTNC